MNVSEIAPGLHYWTARHPSWQSGAGWPEEVGCVCYEAPTATVLIDPLLPRGEEDEALRTLDGWVAHRDGNAAVLLTAPWHQRSASTLADRYGVTVWAHESAQARLSFRTRSGPLPDGVELFVAGNATEGQVAFFLRPARALVVAEFFFGADDALHVLPSPVETDPEAFHVALRGLLELPINHVLVAHGKPVLEDGRARIVEALGVHA